MNQKDKLEEALLKAITENIDDNDIKYLSDREDEVKEFFNMIDFIPLFNKIREYIGDNSIEFTTPELGEMGFSNYPVRFNSVDNLKDKCGIMSCVYDNVQIDVSDGGIVNDDKTDELYLWLSVHFNFDYKNGGSNGTKIFNAVYEKTKGWEYSI